jgi:hypothetical protein
MASLLEPQLVGSLLGQPVLDWNTREPVSPERLRIAMRKVRLEGFLKAKGRALRFLIPRQSATPEQRPRERRFRRIQT